jgi:hypothetical protein
MLNYGAAAQVNAAAKGDGYTYEMLANEGMDEYQQFATQSVTYQNNMKVEGNDDIKYLANVRMVDNIKFMMAFYGVDETMSIKVSFEHWNGTPFEKTFKVSDLDKNGDYYVIILEDTVMADGFQDIRCEVIDANGTNIATVTDSIASYCARMNEKSPLYSAIMKLAYSAREKLGNE